jgi:hypothetical protein
MFLRSFTAVKLDFGGTSAASDEPPARREPTRKFVMQFVAANWTTAVFARCEGDGNDHDREDLRHQKLRDHEQGAPSSTSTASIMLSRLQDRGHRPRAAGALLPDKHKTGLGS